MKYLDFESEILTPMFLGGAETRIRPELRAPSIRGAMRYWHRTISVAAENEDGLNRLKDNESDIFGTTEKGSAVAVRISSVRSLEVETFRKDRALRTPEGDFLPSGKDYLLWSMAASGQPGTPRYQPAREYIKPGTQFTIRLQSWNSQADETLVKAAASFWLLANLGGLGSRVNRGAGSFEIIGASSIDKLTFKRCCSIDELCEYLSSGIRQCLHIVSGSETWKEFREEPEYDVLAPSIAEIWVVSSSQKGWANALEALEGLGAKLRDYRSYRSPIGRADHDQVLKWIEGGGSPPPIRRAVFGLPIPFRYSDGGPSDVIIPKDGNRRASPLRIRITRLTSGYVGVLTLFKSRFLQAGQELQLQTRKWTAPPPDNYAIIQDFIKTFEVKQEVKL